MARPYPTSPGRPYPLGATAFDDGVRFVLYSQHATAVDLLLYDRFDDPRPAHVISLDRRANRTFHYWHIFVHGLRPGQVYAYRVDGPWEPERGHRFDATKVLLDPYAREVIYGANWSRAAAKGRGANDATALKGVVTDPSAYDWEGDVPLRTPFSQTVIYEMHVAGFTRHPSAGVDHPGTYRGLIHKIPYLQELGVTAVELLPVQQFDEQDVLDRLPRGMPPGATCTSNYWGYNPIAFFAPHRGYCVDLQRGDPVREFRDMVKAFHRAGIEVILDVVFNHTAEGDHSGPTISLRGLENRTYYLLEPDQSRYSDYTGTGNTVNGNHSIVRRLILDALHYWVDQMHVDGFRFDLASVLSRDEWGQPMRSPPILWDIESDPHLVGTKLIAEAWDAAGLYQVGSFIGHRWAEWNGRYRDDVRRFLRGDEGMVVDFAARLAGSGDIYAEPDHALHRSINFVTAHDGFTLADLVSYERKHNEANGEANQDGTDANYSANYGHEGQTDDPAIDRIRLQQIKNALTTLLVSQGTPMLLYGDEIRRTQGGNNNAYCQNNETSWLDWRGIQQHGGLLRFVQRMVAFRRAHPVLRLQVFPPDADSGNGNGERRYSVQESLTFHGTKLGQPDWGLPSHTIALELQGRDVDDDLYVVVNAYHKDLTFEIPSRPPQRPWLRAVDTALPSPDDIVDPGHEPPVAAHSYRVKARSVVILVGRDEPHTAPHAS